LSTTYIDAGMGETFYTALGVDGDADGDGIRRAYRDLVKECHPDVSDDPTAPERLTTARNVLLVVVVAVVSVVHLVSQVYT
jgi:DnaJ-domain-containing protein 1